MRFPDKEKKKERKDVDIDEIKNRVSLSILPLI